MKKNLCWGALIGFFLSLFLWLFYIITIKDGFGIQSLADYSELIFRRLYFFSVIGWRSLLLSFPNLAMYEFYIFPSISLSLYGSVIGGLYDLIKRKRI